MTEAITMPQIDKIAAALAAAQGELTNPPKTKTANLGKYKYRYADLAEIIEHVRPVLSKHKLAVAQLTIADPRNLLITRLIHESGQYLESVYPLPAQAAAQDMGSAITYARRYSLCAILGIAADEDDDGAGAMRGESNQEKLLRDELIEAMGRASLGNHAVLTFTRANNLGDGETVEDLPVATVKKLLEDWPSVVEACKAQRKVAPSQPAKPTPQPAQTQPPAATSDDLAGIDEGLAKLMRKDGISAVSLKAYYVGAGHLPASVEPQKLPATYVKAITSPENWTKAVTKMKEIA